MKPRQYYDVPDICRSFLEELTKSFNVSICVIMFTNIFFGNTSLWKTQTDPLLVDVVDSITDMYTDL